MEQTQRVDLPSTPDMEQTQRFDLPSSPDMEQTQNLIYLALRISQ